MATVLISTPKKQGRHVPHMSTHESTTHPTKSTQFLRYCSKEFLTGTLLVRRQNYQQCEMLNHCHIVNYGFRRARQILAPDTLVSGYTCNAEMRLHYVQLRGGTTLSTGAGENIPTPVCT